MFSYYYSALLQMEKCVAAPLGEISRVFTRVKQRSKSNKWNTCASISSSSSFTLARVSVRFKCHKVSKKKRGYESRRCLLTSSFTNRTKKKGTLRHVCVRSSLTLSIVLYRALSEATFHSSSTGGGDTSAASAWSSSSFSSRLRFRCAHHVVAQCRS